jgi:hypothetical protein
MRFIDVITPQELCQIFDKEIGRVRSFGQREDLILKWTKNIQERISQDYLFVLQDHIPDQVSAIQMWRLLCLIDWFLEEKYANSNTRAD